MLLGGVEEAEAGIESDDVAVAVEEALGHGVERATHHARGKCRFGQVAGPGEHLRRRSPGEGQQTDALRLHPPGQQVGHPGGQGGRLACPRSGKEEQGRVAVLDRSALLAVEVVEHVFGTLTRVAAAWRGPLGAWKASLKEASCPNVRGR